MTIEKNNNKTDTKHSKRTVFTIFVAVSVLIFAILYVIGYIQYTA